MYFFVVELIEYGVRIEIYENGFIYVKMMIIDGGIVFVGLVNIDVCLFRLDFEVNILIYDEWMVFCVRKVFFEDLKILMYFIKEVYENWGMMIKMKEGLVRLILLFF